jgi:hypothetical protein
VLFVVREDATEEEVEDLTSSLGELKSRLSNVIDPCVGEGFSGWGGGYTYGLFARFRSPDDLWECLQHPEHRAAVEELDAATVRRIAVDCLHESLRGRSLFARPGLQEHNA